MKYIHNIGVLVFGILGCSGFAMAHPFSQEEYSLRTAMTVSEKGVVPLVVLEVPIPIALRDIGAQTEDPRDVKKRKIKAYNEKQWSELSDNLIFMIDGEEVKGEWLAIDHPANGKATEGFFVYMVSFNFAKAISVHSGMTVSLNNNAYLDEKMVYSGSVTTKAPIAIESNSFDAVLGENQNLELSDPKRWTTDPTLRKLDLVIK